MNPFLHDPVASPLVSRPAGSWQFPFSKRACPGMKYRAGAVAIAAGVGVGFSAQAIDVNTASVADLERVRGVGPRTAQIIVQERSRAGHFESLEDLSDRVRGIGPKRLQTLQSAGLRVAGDSNGVLTAALGEADMPLSAGQRAASNPGSDARPGSKRASSVERRSPADIVATPLITPAASM